MRMLASPSPSGFAQDRACCRKVRVTLGIIRKPPGASSFRGGWSGRGGTG